MIFCLYSVCHKNGCAADKNVKKRIFGKNPPIKHNLRIADISLCTNLSVIRRFHCSCVSQLLARAAPVAYTNRVCAEGLHFSAFHFYCCRELLNVNWKKPDREKKAPNVTRLIRRTNEVSSFTTTVFEPSSLKLLENKFYCVTY